MSVIQTRMPGSWMPEGAVTAMVTAPSAFLWGDAQTPTRANASRLMPLSSTTLDHSRALCRLWSR